MDPLTIIGTVFSIAYIIFVILLQWISDWYFNVEESPLLTHLYSCWLYVTTKEPSDG